MVIPAPGDTSYRPRTWCTDHSTQERTVNRSPRSGNELMKSWPRPGRRSTRGIPHMTDAALPQRTCGTRPRRPVAHLTLPRRPTREFPATSRSDIPRGILNGG